MFHFRRISVTIKSKPPANASRRIEEHIRLRVVCQDPPPPERYAAEFGLQDNSTAAEWVIHAGRVFPNGDIHFECECRVRPQKKTGSPNFLGNYVQGSPFARFLYLSWRPRDWAPGKPEPPCGTWLRRMKVNLSSITWEQIDEALKLNAVLEAVVRGTGRDGGPSCGSVPLVGGGWVVQTK
jgi:Family of unknown function (DUF5990)